LNVEKDIHPRIGVATRGPRMTIFQLNQTDPSRPIRGTDHLANSRLTLEGFRQEIGKRTLRIGSRKVRRIASLAVVSALALTGGATASIATSIAATSAGTELPAPNPVKTNALAPLATASADLSGNWAGNIAHNQTFTEAEAAWTVPSVSGSAGDSSQWVGIGLGSAPSVPLYQAGTESDGGGTYTMWTEVVPQQSSEHPVAGLTVHAGDQVSVHIIINSTGASFHIRDDTNGYDGYPNGWTGVHNADGHAEWIDERPTVTIGGVSYLTEYADQSVTFTNAQAYSAASGWLKVGASSHYYDEMVDCDSGAEIAHPGSIISSTTFTVTYDSHGEEEPTSDC
jgi:hypothetical protein